jgi:hypothetical protein
LGEEIREKISDKVKRSEYRSVMADTTPNISHVDELSVAVRFVDADTLKREEHLVYVKETYDKTGEGQAKDIVDSLKSADIPLSTVQFQTYDSTSSMSGVHKGAQQKFTEILERKIPYIKCVPHGVNLVIEHGCQESSLVGKTFATLENIFVFFTKSTKRNKELKDKLEEIENASMLRNLSKTRWSARAESVKAVWRSLDAILDVLEILEGSKDGETKTKAANLLNSVRNIDFICGIMLLKNVMFKMKMLSDFLQGETVDAAGALVAMSSTDGVLKRMRSDDNEINDEIEAAIIVARNLGTEPLADFSRLHRLRRPSRRLDDNPSTATPVLNDITAFYRCEFFKFIDSLISTLGEKSQSLTNVFQPFLKVIDPDTPGSLEDARALVAALPSVFSQDTFATLHSEFKVFFEHFHQKVQGVFHTDDKQPCRITRAANIALSLASKHGLFKLVSRVYQLFLTCSCAVCL